MIEKLVAFVGAAAATVVIAFIIVTVLCLAPWLLFWVIETLFGYHIEFTFWTWLAAVVGLALVRGGNNGRS